ncbi:alpha-1,2-mannosidase, putative [Rhizobium sp. RU36D]|nr:alpha-1,2-mannosidase, putative [Rhizobium sp. RU36D]
MKIRLNRRLVLSLAAVLVVSVLVILSLFINTRTSEIVTFVDPFIGTAGDHGQLSPAATLPYGMVKLGPDTATDEADAKAPKPHSGYDFESNSLIGFSHTRSQGVGCEGSGGVLLVRPSYVNDAQPTMDKSAEKASPGYYSVSYGSPSILAELTATAEAGVHRYTFTKTGRVQILFDFGHAHSKPRPSGITAAKGDYIDGFSSATTVCDFGAYKVHASAVLSRAPVSWTTNDAKAVAVFDMNAGEQLVVSVGLSSIGQMEARAHAALQSRQSFESLVKLAAAAWERELGRVQVEGDPKRKRRLYTALYHAMQMPYFVARKGRSYRGSDGNLQVASVGDQYFGWSLWDTFRTQQPLLNLLDPTRSRDMTRSLADLYSQGKQPWATANEPGLTVRTEFAPVVLLDGFRKGALDVETARRSLPYAGAEASAYGEGKIFQSLEAAYQHWAVAELACDLGDQDLAIHHWRRSVEYRDVWNANFKSVDHGSADKVDLPGLYEGTIWQYRWFVPHDIEWIRQAVGGGDALVNQLEEFFNQGYFNIANQPDIQVPYLFAYLGRPWRTQDITFRYATQEMDHWYGTHEKRQKPWRGMAFQDSPRGFVPEMDDDAGTMSSWFALSALGIYPSLVGEPLYTLTSPIFPQSRLTFDSGKVFTIEARGLSDAAHFIQKASLNGKPLERAWLTHDEITSGGELVLEMGATPNQNWGLEKPKSSSVTARTCS